MKQRLILSGSFLSLLCFLSVTVCNAQESSKPKENMQYEFREKSPGGTGKFYMGREIAGIMAPEDAAGLEAAYIFLRRTEHMLQYREDEQTHLLPRDAQRHAALAQAMGMETRVFET